MIINESGLLKAMKDSYKLGGYHVAAGTVFAKKCYLIAGYGYGWSVVIQQHKVPRKILVLLAEHIGRLPETEEAFLCKKDHEPQEEMLDVAANPILAKLGDAQQTYLPAVKKTRLIWDGANVWQSASIPDVILIRPDLENIAVFKDVEPRMVGKCMYLEGQASHVLIHQTAPGETEKDMVANLGKHTWM